jgi:hypothetical protein
LQASDRPDSAAADRAVEYSVSPAFGFIAHYIIPFWKRPKTISRYLFEVELCFYKFKIKQNK